MRIGFDLAKAHHADGIGTWQRQVARALAERVDGERTLVPLFLTEPWSVGLQRRIYTALDDAGDAFDWKADPLGPEDVAVSSAWAVPPRFDGRLLYVVHDLTFLSHPHCHTRANRIHCLEGLMRAALVADTRFVTVSQSTADMLAGWLGPDAFDTTVVYNGVGEAWRPLPEEEVTRTLRDRFQLARDTYVLSVGSLEPRKNLRRLLDAHRALSGDLRQRYPLVLAAGHGWLHEKLADELRQDPHVRLLGRIRVPDLVALYNGTALFVYPSLAEGFGLPPAEALACGAPVLTSNTTSLPEVVGSAAETVDPEDSDALFAALRGLLLDPERRRELGRRGPARAALFTWRQTARKLLELI